MATPLTEGPYAGEFILSEANGNRSRDTVTVELQEVEGGENGIDAGTVMGMRASDGKYLAYDGTATDGTETVAGILYGPVPDGDAGDVEAVVVNADAEVIGEKILGPEASEDDVAAGLAALGIKIRGELDFG